MVAPKDIIIVTTAVTIHKSPPRWMLDLELLILALIVFKYETLLTELVQLEPFFLADFPNRSLPLLPNTLAAFDFWGLDDLDFEDCIMKKTN